MNDTTSNDTTPGFVRARVVEVFRGGGHPWCVNSMKGEYLVCLTTAFCEEANTIISPARGGFCLYLPKSLRGKAEEPAVGLKRVIAGGGGSDLHNSSICVCVCPFLFPMTSDRKSVV